MIAKCNCKSKYQDEKYGEGMRVFTYSGIKDTSKKKCTVCGKDLGSDNKDKKNK